MLIRSWLVHLFNGLEWQHNIANLVGLTVPNKLNLPVIFKKQKTIFFG